MDESLISQINAYKSVVEEDLDGLIDFLISTKVLNEKTYCKVWKIRQPDRLHELFSIINSNGNLETVLKYLKDTYPNHEKDLKEERNFRIASVRGGFPDLPPNYVSRKSLVDEVKFKLQDLKWNQKLVIHGMMGYGKSCLINDLLRNKIVRQYFDNYVFWINLGDCHNKKDAWQPMWRLYTTAILVLERTKISHCHDDLDALKELLTNLFLEDRLKNSLIILDDVGNREVLTCFDIKTKTVISTHDKNILGRENVIFVEVKTGFSAKESLELFKKSLKTTQDLPNSAEEIHNICQGHPMLISLIGSYLNENAEAVRAGEIEIWEYIKDKFLKGHYRLNEYNNEIDIPRIINRCIEKLLTDNLRDLYLDLAIFEPDVNIPPEVLQILWHKSKFEVRNIMNTLAEKSLVVPFYHDDLETYIYGIHDIYLKYLREVTKTNTKDLHRKLLAGYDRVTNQNYEHLPNDNYTLQFIGYHMYHGEEFGKFSVYLNLKFLELKLKSVGTEDVLRDMHKYEKYITREDRVLKERLSHYTDFIRRCGGNLYSYEKTDIIQYALRENKDSHVFKDALLIAKKSQQLYFQLQKPLGELDYSHIINIRDDITSACFVDSPQHILIGTTNGKIKLFYEQSVKEISNFVGHVGAIKNMIISPDKRHFLSVSIDGTVMLWKFAADSSRNSRDFTNGFPISPKTKQSHWQDVHTPDRGQISPRKKFKVSDNDDFLVSAAFCNNFPDTFRIATGSDKGKVIIWDALNESPLYETARRGMPAPCVIYTEYDDKESVIFGYQDTIFIYEVIDEKLQYMLQLHNNEDCKSIFSCDNKKILVVSDNNITMWTGTKKTVICENEKKNNICSTLTYDNQYLVVSTNQSTVYIWDIEQENILREFQNKGLAKSLDTFYDEDKSVHILLIGSDKKTLQQCHIQPHEREPQVENVPVFTPYWKKKNALTATASQDNRLQIFNGYILISESDILDSEITCTCFSVCGNNVIYGMKNGDIRSFNVRTKHDTCLEKGNSVPVTYLKCFDPSNSYQYRKPSVSSGGSADSLDFLDSYVGVIVSVSGSDAVAIYNEKKVFKRTVTRPVIFHSLEHIIIVDSVCNMYTWNVGTDDFLSIKNPFILEPVTLLVASFCPHKSLIGTFCDAGATYFFDVYHFLESGKVELLKRFEFIEKVKTAKFSCDGSLLAIGTISGAIEVYNIDENYKNISLKLHEDPIQDLIFSPHKEPILVSLGEEIAWWNLRTFQRPVYRRGRPNSIDILESLTSDLNSMDISFWSERQPLKGWPHLLSFVKLNDKAKYMSASNDFNSFLAIDVSGKVYIMDIVHPDI